MGAPSWAIPYLNKVNNVQVDGFFWKDGTSYPIIGFEQYPSLQMVANNYSCYSNENDIYVSSNRTNNFYIIDLFDLQITSSNNVYSINQTVNRTSVRMPDAWGVTYAYLFYMDATSGTQKVAVPQGQTPPYTESINFSVSGTIQEIIEWVSKHFRNVNVYVDGEYWSGINVPAYTSNGGGATHIAKVTGQLKDLSSNLSDILMVSGGGGGGYLTGVPGWDGHEIDILWSGENNKMTAQRANDILTFKLYTSGTEIYSFNSPVADPININLSFASDSENQVARPAFVYYDGSSSYSYNQEAPTDEEMGDIYTWLSAGLPSE